MLFWDKRRRFWGNFGHCVKEVSGLKLEVRARFSYINGVIGCNQRMRKRAKKFLPAFLVFSCFTPSLRLRFLRLGVVEFRAFLGASGFLD